MKKSADSDRKQSEFRTSEDEEKVGYGRPPISTRFQPGRSGNPSGRPPNKKASVGMVGQRVLSETIKVTEGGKPRKMSKFEAIMRRAANDALNGKSIKPLLDLCKTFSVPESFATELLKQQAEIPSVIRVEFVGKNRPRAGQIVKSDDAGNVWTNPEGDPETSVLLYSRETLKEQ
jgi:Family of unknown function (DUF5681)